MYIVQASFSSHQRAVFKVVTKLETGWEYIYIQWVENVSRNLSVTNIVHMNFKSVKAKPCAVRWSTWSIGSVLETSGVKLIIVEHL